jgi:phosphoglycerate dehydrogenase-like enzyme
MNIVAFDPHVDAADMSQRHVKPMDLEELLGISDFVSLHLPLTARTWHLIGESKIKLMKPSSILINTSRGAIVDEQALLKALEQGRLFGAGLDVFEIEPPSRTNPLFALSNVVLTPHCAAHTHDATQRVRKAAIRAVISVLRNEVPSSLVNPEICQKALP